MGNQEENKISTIEAQASLDSISIIEQSTNTMLRPPLWLNFVISVCYGLITLGIGGYRESELEILVIIASVLGFLVAVGFYFYTNRLLGLKLNLLPKNKSEVKFHILTAMFFAVVIILSDILFRNSFWWGPIIGGIINAIALGITLHKYPTYNFNVGQK